MSAWFTGLVVSDTNFSLTSLSLLINLAFTPAFSGISSLKLGAWRFAPVGFSTGTDIIPRNQQNIYTIQRTNDTRLVTSKNSHKMLQEDIPHIAYQLQDVCFIHAWLQEANNTWNKKSLYSFSGNLVFTNMHSRRVIIFAQGIFLVIINKQNHQTTIKIKFD